MLKWIPNYLACMPLHLQLVKHIHKKVVRQEFSSGDPLPGINTLCSSSKVQKYIIQCAYEVLRRQGVIYYAGEQAKIV